MQLFLLSAEKTLKKLEQCESYLDPAVVHEILRKQVLRFFLFRERCACKRDTKLREYHAPPVVTLAAAESYTQRLIFACGKRYVVVLACGEVHLGEFGGRSVVCTVLFQISAAAFLYLRQKPAAALRLGCPSR